MQSRLATTITCYGLLALAGGVSFLLPDTLTVEKAQAQAGPDVLLLRGTVRDFLMSHPDYNVMPATGFGHYAGSVGTALGPGQTPVLVGGGYKVAMEWTDESGNIIAPNLYGVNRGGGGGAGIVINEVLGSRDTSSIDSYDSSLGPYGVGNQGAEAVIHANTTAPGAFDLRNDAVIAGDVSIGPGGDPAVVLSIQQNAEITGTVDNLAAAVPMPVLVPPDMPGPDLGNVQYNGGVTTISSDMKTQAFNVSGGGIVQIDGDVTLWVTGDFTMENSSQLVLLPGASLEIFFEDNFNVKNMSQLNYNGDPSRVHVYSVANKDVIIRNKAKMAATVESPNYTMNILDQSEFFGTFIGLGLDLRNASKFHMDTAGEGNCGVTVNDMAGLAGVASSGGITSAATFAEWFDDVLGVNQSMRHDIFLTRNILDQYEYSNNDFYPADGKLLGNEGDIHNKYFSYEIDARFTYEACTGQYVRFQGGDGMWMFIDGEMVMDLGGVVPFADQFIEVDRLGLTDGEEYDVHLFFADRHPFVSIFRLTTNIELSTPGIPTVTAIFD